MNSYSIVEWGKPLQSIRRSSPQPQGGQVLVRVKACGVCHSDLHIQDGHIDLGNGAKASFADAGATLPFTPGHEIVGVVAAKGPSASVALDTECVVYPWIGCGTCRACTRDRELQCENPRSLGTRVSGGFAEFVLVEDERYLVPYGDLDPLMAATCACSALTAYSALQKIPECDPEDSILVIGGGGLGQACIRLSKLLTRARILAVDPDPAKRAAALRVGADEVFEPGPQLSAEVRKAAGGGVRAVLDFVGSGTTTATALQVIAKGGSIVIVGLYGGSLNLPPAMLAGRGVSLQGSYVGSLAQMKELMQLLQQRRERLVPIEAVDMSQLNAAFDRLRRGEVEGRLVAVA